MKLIFILVCVLGLLSSMAESGYAQSNKLTLSLKDASIKKVLNYIESNSEFSFMYENSKIDVNSRVSIKVKEETIETILKRIFSENIDYQIVGKHIILFPGEKELEEKQIKENQGQQQNISGKVTDQEGKPLPGVTITIVGTTRGVITDNDGTYHIEAQPTDKLVFSFIGMESQIIDIRNQKVINIQLKEKKEELEEVTVVAFGQQQKESVISSIETIKSDELRIPSSNLTTSFAGRMSGVISYQRTGEPGEDNAQFFIRGITSFGTGKVDPLILIDNIEMTTTDLAHVHPDNIASFSILKDATATALYGARGANGVILVQTKSGREGPARVSVRLENSMSAPTQNIELADPITFMKFANEAAKTRDPMTGVQYTNEKIDNTIRATNPYVYPSVDWMDMLFKDVTMNQRANLNISGGGNIARYYISGAFSQDNGILQVDKRNNFNNNIDLKNYNLRSNININITNTTEAVVRLHGSFMDYTGPISGGSSFYTQALKSNPVRFPPYFEPDDEFKFRENILFGNYIGVDYLNPYAELMKGYREYSRSVMYVQMELKQDLSKWIDGLNARILGNTQRNGYFDLNRAYIPYYYDVLKYDRMTDKYTLFELNPEQGTEYLSYNPGAKTLTSSFYSEAAISYNNTFNDKHGVSGLLVATARNMKNANASTLAESLNHRNLGLAGRFTYEYANRYLGEFNFGYNGSEKFDKGHRWGFFPSIGLGWIVSNEPFMEGINNVISNLKIRGTYGLVGNDEIGSERFFYLSRVTIGGGGSFTTGHEFNGRTRKGVYIDHYPNSEIGWEIARKSNLGIELGLFESKIKILADIFKEERTNILQVREDITSEMGLWSIPQVNVGKATGNGVDMSLDYDQYINEDLWFVGRLNFTFAQSTYNFFEEPDYSDIPWRSKIGQPLSQQWGYIAERLFIDEKDVENSPRQDFGQYGAGDIKYTDINDDGVINEIDLVPIGYPTVPEINYGFGLSSGYKKLDFSFFFQGSGRSSFWIDPNAMTPFIQSSSGGRIIETGLAQFIADDLWTEATQNPFAGWPRLSTYPIVNNLQRSTFYMHDGKFLRLKSAEIGYSLPTNFVNKLKLRSCRFYVSGSNLFLMSKFDLWDIEMGGNGLGYPLQRVINLGLNITF